MKSIICLGPCCSGKTTWSIDFVKKNTNCIRFSLDEFRSMTTGSLLSNNLDDKYMSILYNFIIMLNYQHKDIIIDNIPLEPQWLSMLIGVPHEIEIRLFDVEFKDSLIRNNFRKNQGGHFVKPSELHRYYIKYIEFINSKGFKDVTNKEKVTVVCDDFININKQFIA